MTDEVRLRYEPGLDGLRALAVVAVVLFHDGRLRGGFLGVSTFFTLSGFLITGLLLTEQRHTGRVSLRRFYTRRLRRLLPAALGGIVVATAVTLVLQDATTSARFPGDALASVGDVANWRSVWSGRAYADLFSTPSPLLHYWSLAIEEQFYLVLAPLLVLLGALTRGRRGTLAAVLVGLAGLSFLDGWWLVGRSLDRAYYGTDTRALEFLVGAIAATIVVGRPLPRRAARAMTVLGPFALAGLALAATRQAVTDPNLFRGALLAYSLAGVIVVLATREPGPVRALCSWAPLRALGRISYGVYVYHWPIFLWLTPARTGWSAGPVTALRMTTTLAVAAVSYHAFESPIRARRRVVGRVAWVGAPAFAASVTAFALVVGAAGPAPAITYAPARPASALLGRLQPARLGPLGTTGPRGLPAARVLVVGDSVALTMGRGLERWGDATGRVVWNGGALGASLVTGVAVRGYWGVATRPPQSCATHTTWHSVVAKLRPQVVVVLYGAWDVYDASWDGGATWYAPGDPVWNARYAAAVDDTARCFTAAGATVLWVASPCFGPAPGTTVGGPWYDPRRVAAINAVLRSVASKRPGMVVTDVERSAGCPVNFRERPDDVHYSDAGATAAAKRLAPVITRVAAP